MRSPDAFAVLDLSPDATLAQARRAFRRLVLELHPDRNGGDESASARLRRIVTAYETIIGKPRPRRARAAATPTAWTPPGRYGCVACGDGFEVNFGGCVRCDLPLVDRHGPAPAAATSAPTPDPRVETMEAELERRAIAAPGWLARVAPHTPAVSIGALILGGGAALTVHLPVATILLSYGLGLLALEGLGRLPAVS